jgi:hypothetical protein
MVVGSVRGRDRYILPLSLSESCSGNRAGDFRRWRDFAHHHWICSSEVQYAMTGKLLVATMVSRQ